MNFAKSTLPAKTRDLWKYIAPTLREGQKHFDASDLLQVVPEA